MEEFKIAAAQIASISGNLDRNLAKHLEAIAAAAEKGVSVLVFPELSLTGYEPDLAESHAIAPLDIRLKPLEEAARRHRMHLSVGAPSNAGGPKPSICVILFSPDGSRRIYAKMHLGGSEPNFFVAGSDPLDFEADGQKIGISICADSSAPSHPQTYAGRGATIYSSGVFLTREWFATDAPRLASYAPAHRLLVVMANHAASVGSLESVGRSAVWAPDGSLLAQAAGTEEALVIATRGPDAWRAEVRDL